MDEDNQFINIDDLDTNNKSVTNKIINELNVANVNDEIESLPEQNQVVQKEENDNSFDYYLGLIKDPSIVFFIILLVSNEYTISTMQKTLSQVHYSLNGNLVTTSVLALIGAIIFFVIKLIL